MKKNNTIKRVLGLILCFVLLLAFSACGDINGMRQSDRVSDNLSKEADNFNITRQLTVFNTRTDMVLFTMKGNFSKETESDGDVTIVGENPDGSQYKHFIYLNGDVTYIIEDVGHTTVSKYQYEININPKFMFVPFKPIITE